MNFIDSKNEFNKQKYLYHFTTFDALKCIICKHRLRLTRSDCLKDEFEDKQLPDLWKQKIFVLSFTNVITDMFWNVYARGKENGVFIRIDNQKFNYEDNICFENGEGLIKVIKSDLKEKPKNNIDCKWGLYYVIGLKVVYKEDAKEQKNIDNEYYSFLDENFSQCENITNEKIIESASYYENTGYLKDKDTFEDESEYRLRCAVRPYYLEFGKNDYYRPIFPYLYLDLNDMNFCTIIIHQSFRQIDDLISLCKEHNVAYEIID